MANIKTRVQTSRYFKSSTYRIVVLDQVPQESVSFFADIVQVDVGHRVGGILMLVHRWT